MGPRWLHWAKNGYILISTQTRMGVCVRFYVKINPIESVKLPSVNNFDESKMATSKMASFVVLIRSTALSPKLHSITILEGNRGNCVN